MLMKLKRLHLSLLTGAILGIFCIVGVTLRMGFAGNGLFIFATFINRLVLGLVVGLLPRLKNTKLILFRGAAFGMIIGGSFYLSTIFYDFPGFIASITYGVIIDYIATKFGK